MNDSKIAKLNQMAEDIHDGELSILIEHMADLIVHENDSGYIPEDPREQTKKEKTVSILLRSLRIHLCLELIQSGYTQCRKELMEDWQEIVDCMTFMEYEWNATEEVLSDTVDIIMLCGSQNRKMLLRQLDFSTRIRIKECTPLRPFIVTTSFRIAEYCYSHEHGDKVGPLMDRLIALSEVRNAKCPDRHREVVRKALWYTVDYHSQLTVQICENQNKYFDSIVDFNSGRFYWYYAFALSKIGRHQESFQLFKLSHEICKQVEGEKSWISARAGQSYYLFQIDTDEGEKYLWDFLDKIESNFYTQIDASSEVVGAYTRYALLKKHMDAQSLSGYFSEIEKLRDFCYKVQENPPEARLTVRTIENMLSAYHLSNGDLLQAARHSLNALSAITPKQFEPIPSDDLLYSNLLQIYSQLNDADSMIELIDLLSAKLSQYEDNDYYYYRICLLIQSAEKRLGLSMVDRLDAFREDLLAFHQAIHENDIDFNADECDGENLAFALWVLEMAGTVMDATVADQDELKCYHNIITFFLEQTTLFHFTQIQKMLLHMLLAQAEWQLGSNRLCASLEKCLNLSKVLPTSNETAISVTRFASVLYSSIGHTDRAVFLAKAAIDGITEAWHKATAYLNDQKICQLLSVNQTQFSICLGVLRNRISDRELYEYILRYKDLPALVGRERNRILRLTPIDDELRKQVFSLQNQLAAAQMQDSLIGTDTARDTAINLQRLEADFADKFPHNIRFTDISLTKVLHNIPDNSVILEYYFIPGDHQIYGSNSESEDQELHVFIVGKRSDKEIFHHIKLPDGDTIYQYASSFSISIQDPEKDSADIIRDCQDDLYHLLLDPAIPYLEGMRTIYIAPDDILCNLPFEILRNSRHVMLQDEFKVCRIVCGRDFVFSRSDGDFAASSFVLGNPDYEAVTDERNGATSRRVLRDYQPVHTLPFSGIEARRVAAQLNTTSCTGQDATKYALEEALPCGIIHLATHGFFDDQSLLGSLYSAQLVFAGYNRWVSRVEENGSCGNGILTADEISRLDLRQTKLVVLSACQTGLGDVRYRSTQGLLSAFAATGVRWVVSHLWEANDFSTAILMDSFYDYLNRGLDVPDALDQAKHYLQKLTVGEIRRNGWFDAIDEDTLGPKGKEELAFIKKAPDRRKFFGDEFFWGGFICHKCN